jgi:TRAP-type transport system small permease protein
MHTTSQNGLERLIAAFCRAILWLATSVIFVILVANTGLRYLTGSSLQWANEVPELLFPWLVMAGVVLASLQGAHIATTFLVESQPASRQRVIASVSWCVVAGLYATLSWSTFQMLDIVHDEKSPILQVPGSITYACVMAGMGLLAVLAVISAWRTWRTPPASRPTEGAEPAVPTAHW